MNRSLGTSSFPRCAQYDVLRKSAVVYFGGTGDVRGFDQACIFIALQVPHAFPLGTFSKAGVLVAQGCKVRYRFDGQKFDQVGRHRCVLLSGPQIERSEELGIAFHLTGEFADGSWLRGCLAG